MRWLLKVHSIGSSIRVVQRRRNMTTIVEPLKKYDAIKSRDDPVIFKLQSPEFLAVLTEEVLVLKNLFDKYQHQLRLAGGPVRDLLMGIVPKDLDFATTATPGEMKEMFTKENVRMINVNGEKHGTITARINDKENFEVTTLRIDMITDGRHAEVQFTADWKLDANRRDLTFNSMFLDFDGSVYDYFYGYDDLMAKRVRFVGDADTRIKEDYLRILRYFRFYGRISETECNHCPEILQRIEENALGLKRISGERIWVELKKILSGRFPSELLKTMLQLDMGKYIGLPEKHDLVELDRVSKNENLHPISLLSSQLRSMDDAIELNNRLKFSVYDRDLAYFIVSHREPILSEKPLLPYQKLLLNSKIKSNTMREYIIEVLKYIGDEKLLKEFQNWETPKFYHIPVPMLNRNGATVPKYYSMIINDLKMYWADNNFNSTVEELEMQIPIIAKQYELTGNIKRKRNLT